MESFLRGSCAALKRSAEDGSGVHVVLGNEACDLDSMVSALAFAYFLAKTTANPAVVPVLNIRRSEFPLRPENTFLLREAGLPQEGLLFRDEIDLQALHRTGRLALTLVDHNILPRADGSLEGAVVEVIDHHHLDRVPSPSCPLTVEPVGSCATLVTEHISQRAPEVLDRQVAQLLYGTIVLDCVNMAPEAGKVTPKDSQYVALLEARFPDLPPRGALFDALQNAKFDVSGLSTEQMLLKDMKAESGGDVSLAVSVVYVILETFLQRPGLQQELCEFCHRHRYSVLVVMTISFNERKEPFRQIAVYSASTALREQVSQALERAQNPDLNLSPMSSPYADVKAYLQGNTLASRKKVMPILKTFLRGLEGRTRHYGEVEDLGELEDQFDPSRCPPFEEDTRLRWCSASRRHRHPTPEEEDSQVPPTPMNSLVEGCPLDNGPPRFSAEAILEKFGRMAEENSEEDASSGGP
ncbi:exopolyphosphatase PRUNE1 isoform X1 [Lepisosteus oculatus]|uniref:exopolyphosphatase PRUNE1 isoform X1 n=2 Tax=Lepisosteus oculatus TaxID=7918 RepID=UPI000740533F|nr:PREDICTED: protein prune homolog isoform X1 [Lepisosteus oculatus]